VAISERFENVRLVGPFDQSREQGLLEVPYPHLGDFHPLGLVATEPPLIPYSAIEMNQEQLATAIANGEPELHYPAPPDIAEFVLVTPMDQQCRTLGGQIPTDLWQMFVNAPDEPEYLHEVLGIADTLCFRSDRPYFRTARQHLREIDSRLLDHLPHEAIGGYCAGTCLEEQRFMDDWFRHERWNEPLGRMQALERLGHIEPVVINEHTPWMLISYRHMPSLQEVIYSLEDLGIEVDEDEGRLQAVRRAYSHPAFVKEASVSGEIDRFWGFRPLMWQQLWSQSGMPQVCAICGKATDGRKYCSDECRSTADARQQTAYRPREALKKGKRYRPRSRP
jgi:hypothetical protein